MSRAASHWKLNRHLPARKLRTIVAGVKRIHDQPRMADYGSLRMHHELKAVGVACSNKAVAKLIRTEGIRARPKRKFLIATTDSNHDLLVAPNRLNQQFVAPKLKRVGLTDFTYAKNQRRLYLVVHGCRSLLKASSVGNTAGPSTHNFHFLR
jgi:hypothetical protein